MSAYYQVPRTKNLFDPASSAPYKLSRSRLENFLRCARCFYLDRRLGVDVPPGYPFNLNSAVDTLLKKEFDIHRASGTAHPLMTAYGLDLVPCDNSNMDEWRTNFTGVTYHHQPSGFLVSGAVDDIWMDQQGRYYVVDYKSTSKSTEVNLDAEWQGGYKRQMEIYQWLLRHNGHDVDATGYFVYCNGQTDRAAFDGKLEFDIKIIPYTGDDSWVEQALLDAKACLLSDTLPTPAPSCDYCAYRAAARKIEI